MNHRMQFEDTPTYEMIHDLAQLPWNELTVVCIGTDRSTGDSFGPMLGTNLKQAIPNLSVLGTLADPVHGMNLHQIKPTTPYVLAIDACLGQFDHVGQIIFEDKPLTPGAGVKKSLPPIGNWSITGVVNVSGFMEYFVLQNTRLSLVTKMAEATTQLLIEAYQIYIAKKEVAANVNN